MVGSRLFTVGLLAGLASATSLSTRDADPLASCPGYRASNVKTSATGLTAKLTLAGQPCNAYGADLKDLILEVTYESGMRFLFWEWSLGGLEY